MWYLEPIGYIAAFLTITTYSMRDVRYLRVTAICANTFFIFYGFYTPIYPTLFLHSVLLPLNMFRLAEVTSKDQSFKMYIPRIIWVPVVVVMALVMTFLAYVFIPIFALYLMYNPKHEGHNAERNYRTVISDHQRNL